MQFNLVPDPLLRHRLHLAENVFEQFSLERSIEIILSRNNVALLGIPGWRYFSQRLQIFLLCF